YSGCSRGSITFAIRSLCLDSTSSFRKTKRSPAATFAPALHFAEKLNGASNATKRTLGEIGSAEARSLPIKAEFVTRMYSASAYAVCCGSFRAHFVRRIGESVGTMTETRGGFRRRIRTRFAVGDRKSTRLNSSHVAISYAVFCLKKKK